MDVNMEFPCAECLWRELLHLHIMGTTRGIPGSHDWPMLACGGLDYVNSILFGFVRVLVIRHVSPAVVIPAGLRMSSKHRMARWTGSPWRLATTLTSVAH